MSSRMQSALTKPARGSRANNRTKRGAASEDVGEMLLAELADRRTRLRELLRLIHSEVAREMALAPPARMICRSAASSRRNAELRIARAN
jgi:hypothetical protein